VFSHFSLYVALMTYFPADEEIIWKARNAWPCVLLLVVLEFLISIWIHIAQHNPTASNWLAIHKYSFHNSVGLFRVGLWLFIAFLFSDLSSVRSFIEHTGLNRRPTLAGWWAAWVAVGVALLDRCGLVNALTSANPIAHAFYVRGRVASLVYILFVICIGPFCEELVDRGFLFKAFRGSYSLLLSTVLILGFQAYFHLDTVGHSLWALADC